MYGSSSSSNASNRDSPNMSDALECAVKEAIESSNGVFRPEDELVMVEGPAMGISSSSSSSNRPAMGAPRSYVGMVMVVSISIEAIFG